MLIVYSKEDRIMSISQKRVRWMGISVVALALMLLLTLSACSFPGTSSGSSTNNGGSTGSGATSVNPPSHQGTPAGATTTSSTPTSNNGNTKSSGPIVISSPPPAPGGNAHSALVALQDRTLIITNAVKQNGASANIVAISLTLTIKNTSRAAINNQATYYQLVGSEGDAFGQQSSATPTFFGSVAVGASRSGTIVFEIPSAAATGLRLLFRPEVATDTSFVTLKV